MPTLSFIKPHFFISQNFSYFTIHKFILKEKEIANLILKFQKSSRNKSHPCLQDGCEKKAINSHLLQKRGIISSIAEQQHVIEIALNAFKKDFFEFKRIGIGEALSYPGFCNTHDTSLFKEIETGQLNFNEYRTQLLLSYRALMIERRKKEINIDWYNKILSSNTLSPFLEGSFKAQLKESIIEEKLGIQDQEYYKNYFQTNLQNQDRRDFQFIFFELSRIEVCSSAVFTYETSEEIAINNIIYWHKENDPLTEIYFHLLPFPERSIVIIGCLKDRASKCWEYISSFNNGNKDESLKKISDLLICQIENWVCSPKFYLENCKKREAEINRLVRISMKHPNERRSLDFNFFK